MTATFAFHRTIGASCPRVLAKCRKPGVWLSRSQAITYPISSSSSLHSLHKHTPNPSDVSESYSITDIFQGIKRALDTESPRLREFSHYHFNGHGKALRPTIVMLISKAFNCDAGQPEGFLLKQQFVVAMVCEMIHTASLVHDDVIDNSLVRRGNPSVFCQWGQTNAALTGDYILATASMVLSRLRHNEVMRIMSEILENLVQGEFMQLGTKVKDNERFKHYIEKSFRKTASLIANGCKAAVLLGNASREKINMAYEYGKNLGIAFQLVDDLLDYESNEQVLGKPTVADLRLGLATAPVLFAAHEFPQLNALIVRRFSEPGDVETALSLVKKSSGVEQTRLLAQSYGREAIHIISRLKLSSERNLLTELVQDQLCRVK